MCNKRIFGTISMSLNPTLKIKIKVFILKGIYIHMLLPSN